MNEMKMNDDEMSMRWSNHARDISPKEARRVQTMEEMKNEQHES